MKIKITGNVGEHDVNLDVDLPEEALQQFFSQLSIKPSEATVSPLVRSRPEAKTSELAESLDFIKKQIKVSQYQLIDHLADLGLEDSEIKRAIMWLNHHADIHVETQTKGPHSQYHIFHWQPTE
ncbi:hypothetical protein [Litoribacillus peritrichatus]|uniref:Uncharacterized protein n=1 Tax=Litoribacillus peritrichatus TaxID=718191 RepID=A0ABP7MNN2_9GAMM